MELKVLPIKLVNATASQKKQNTHTYTHTHTHTHKAKNVWNLKFVAPYNPS